MAFVLDTSSSYYWPVVFYIPVDDEEKQKIEFTAKYKRLPQKRINQIRKIANKMVLDMQNGIDNTDISDIDIADEIICGWKNVNDAEGNELKYNNKNKAQFLNFPMLATAVVETYFNSLVEEKRKN